ncbi:MAG: S8 family serine peptidase [Dinoroseobacter sp.]|nr:S8 family serine peptidase [Dinoroseobacter sp.]
MQQLFCGFLLLASGVLTAQSSAAQTGPEAAEPLRAAVDATCPLSNFTGFDAQLALPGSWVLEETRIPDRPEPRRILVRLALPGSVELLLERRQAQGQLRQFRATYYLPAEAGVRPAMLAIADGSCRIQSGRALRNEGEVWRFLDQLDGDLETLRWSETLQAPWPEGTDPGGLRVAFVDSGLAYDLEIFQDQLARDANGTPLGYDFWDLDPWPYDGDVARGPFLPIRHGTAVASVFVREAPEAALLPFRYPRPDMSRMGALVERAVKAGARILAMPLGSRKADDWTAFAQALEQHDILAIVSAGNDGRDIDQDPVYPASLDLEQMITVTSADGFGKLAEGSNWGGRHVDVMVPAERLDIVDFRGAGGVASGSSYAVPRLAAMAARILATDPSMSIAELKAQVLARAAPSPFERDGVLAVGWIPDPLAD